MKILLIDIDSTIPNFALKKIEKYHLDRGDEVIWDFHLAKLYADKICELDDRSNCQMRFGNYYIYILYNGTRFNPT